MITTNNILPPLVLTTEEIIEVLTDDPKTSRFGLFSLIRMQMTLKYMDENLSDEDKDIVCKAVLEKREVKNGR